MLRTRIVSSCGVAPKNRLNSRLNCEGALITRPAGGDAGRGTFEGHQHPGFVEADRLEVLQRGCRRDRFEVVVEGRDAHPALRARAGTSMASLYRACIRSRARWITLIRPLTAISDRSAPLLAAEDAVGDLADDLRAEDPGFHRLRQAFEQPDRRLAQGGVELRGVHAACGAVFG